MTRDSTFIGLKWIGHIKFTLPISIFVIFVFGMHTASFSAEFRSIADPETGCVLEMVGDIEDGDHKKLLSLVWPPGISQDPSEYSAQGFTREELLYDGVSRLDSVSPTDYNGHPIRRICLNSEGGSFVEALKIIDITSENLGTVVRRGDKCLSACALIFLSGSFDTGEDGFVLLDRHLHAAGTLGFHAPSLDIPELNSLALVNSAYASALKTVSDVLGIVDELNMDPTLFRYMLSTPPDDMFHIDTPGKASRWRINVYGITAPEEITHHHIANACNSAFAAISSDDEKYVNALHGYGVDSIWTFYPGTNGQIRQSSSGVLEATRPGYLSEASATCVIRFDLSNEPSRSGLRPGAGTVRFRDSEVATAPLAAFQFYGAISPLSDIAREGGQDGRKAVDESVGVCRVVSANGSIVDRERCNEISWQDLAGVTERVFTWPSGSRTIITTSAAGLQINGNSGWKPNMFDAVSQKNYGDCTINRATRNIFCFSEEEY